MLFPTISFGLFFIIVFLMSWWLQDLPGFRKVFLLASSYFFYSTLDLRFLPLLILFPSVNWYLGLRIDQAMDPHRKRWMIFAVILNLSLLSVFKYFDFFSLFFSQWTGLHFPVLDLVLPLGISFYTFQGISYVVDIYRKELSGKQSYLDVILLIAFFPHLVAGPIVRAKEFLPQLQKNVDPDNIPVVGSSFLILGGLFKKIVIANELGINLVDPVWSHPSQYSSATVWLAVYAYAVQIYCDFSAYSDMAIGFAGLLGYRFPENFQQPYRSQSIQDFWKRWHMSLSSWLRDYLYIPLGGNRHGEVKTVRNLFLTMLLGGLWHGANWTFVVWGAIHGLGLSLERIYRRWVKPCSCGQCHGTRTLFVFHFVTLAWIFFRSYDFSNAMDVMGSLFQSGSEVLILPWHLFLIFLGLGMHFFPWNSHWFEKISWNRWPSYAYGFFLVLGLIVVSAFSPQGIAPFIYFRF